MPPLTPSPNTCVLFATDIDASFRVIAEHLYSVGYIRNIEEYLAGIKQAWARGQHAEHVHVEKLDVVFDYKNWLDPHVYDSSGVTLKDADDKAQVRARTPDHPPAAARTLTLAAPCPLQMSGINSARYFLIRKRADGAVAFWYKPQVAHPWCACHTPPPLTLPRTHLCSH